MSIVVRRGLIGPFSLMETCMSTVRTSTRVPFAAATAAGQSVIRPGIEVNVSHTAIRHGHAARVSIEPANDISFRDTTRYLEINSTTVRVF